MYSLEISETCEKDIKRLIKNNMPLKDALGKAINKILLSPEHFKPLKAPLQNMRRVHVLSSFVLIYEIKGETVRLLRFAHHDEAYR
ncbi:MAG: type II toxin-antitoxin system mRNA interferase toxin, RelE/StbE family [Candidatus Aenigmarchaeota archaeon]|nr:type II toxin-antitoxin system mRNA interferase toxin, RelE/StbE family [Candidatus Aenigmarchaeota archaeon]